MKLVISKHIFDIINSASTESAGFPFKHDHCYRLLKNIIHVYNLNRDRSDDGYVMLCSKYLQNISHEYKAYMDWMERVGIVQVDHSYQTSKYCKYYRILEPSNDFMEYDRERLVQVNFKENDALKIFISNIKQTHGISFLAKWLRLLSIDDQMAHDINWKIYQEDKLMRRIGYRKGQYHYEPYFINPSRSYSARKDNIVAIGMKQFYMCRDATSGRVHSNITNLSSRIFPALRIKGQALVGYDIANSQPFLCSALINLLLMDSRLRGNFPFLHTLTPLSTHHNTILTSSTFQSYLNHYITNQTHPHLVMLEDFLSESDLTGVLEFQALCLSGQLYQEISREVFGLEYENENKRRVKDLFFTLFFTKPRNNKNGIPAFKTKYPAVHQIISNIKSLSEDSNYFPVLLQCLESYYIIERVCKRMWREHPKAPLYTKHDSVYTTIDYVDKLKLIMEEEAQLLFGLVPTLKYDDSSLTKSN